MSLENNATSMPFSKRAEKVVRDYLGTMVLLDDQWPENVILKQEEETTPATATTDDEKSTEEVTPEEVLEDESNHDDEAFEELDADEITDSYQETPVPDTQEHLSDDIELLEIEKVAISEGIIFSALKYNAEKRENACLLVNRADILVLDWNLLGTDDGAESIVILKHLAQNVGGPRFVYIFTGKSEYSDIVEEISTSLTSIQPKWKLEKLNDEGTDFRLGPLIFAVRHKGGSEAAKNEPSHMVERSQLITDAIDAMINALSGFLSLGLLELTVRHRKQLNLMMERFDSSFDVAILSEWLDKDSPVDLGDEFREILFDEWRAALDGACASDNLQVMSPAGAIAYCTEKADAIPALFPIAPAEHDHNLQKPTGFHKAFRKKTEDIAKRLWECFEGVSARPKEETQAKFAKRIEKERDSVVESFKAWTISPKDTPLPLDGNERKLTPALLRFCLADGGLSEMDILLSMKRLQTFFAQRQQPASYLTQGTILQLSTPIHSHAPAASGNPTTHLLCITPVCDAARSGASVSKMYCFLQAIQIDDQTLKKKQWNLEKAQVVLVQPFPTEENPNPIPIGLHLLSKPTVVLHVPEPNFANGLSVNAFSWPVPNEEDKQPIVLTQIAQLRADHAMLVTSAAVDESGRVGVNNIEFVREFINNKK